MIYGPGCTDGAGKAFSRPMSLGAIPGSGRQRLSNVRVEDVAAAAVVLSERDDAMGQAYNIADGCYPCIKDALTIAAEAFGTSVPRVHLPLAAMALLARAMGAFAAMRGRIPDLETDAVAYLHHDYVVDNTRLLATGFRLRYPDFAASMQDLGRRWREEPSTMIDPRVSSR
jgi:UDP-glucose 4-epimerase